MKKREITNKKIIELKNVKKHYHLGDSIVRAVDGISLKIGQGEFISIMGHSGSGKSTSMNLIGSLDIPTSGKILLDGIDISKLNESELASLRGRKVGFVFQNFNLIPNLSVLENVMLPMIFQEMNKENRFKRGRKLLQLVELSERMHHKPTELSGGQQQRVAIARALANDPEVILADEPTGNLDTKTGNIVVDFLKKLHKKGKTIIMVTHDDYLSRVAQRKITLEDGMVVGG